MECSVANCSRPTQARGLCLPCYKRMRRSGAIEKQRGDRTPDGECSIEGCRQPFASRGLCKMHYARSRRSGSTGPAGRMIKVAPVDGRCGIADCCRDHYGLGYCHMHYQRLRSSGEVGPTDPMRGTSIGEGQVAEFVASITPLRVVRNERRRLAPFELDIWIPEIAVAIEYDGDYWHSRPEVAARDRIKDQRARDEGITLIRVREGDWLDRRPGVRERLSAAIVNPQDRQPI
jgi:hypothetical protein